MPTCRFATESTKKKRDNERRAGRRAGEGAHGGRRSTRRQARHVCVIVVVVVGHRADLVHSFIPDADDIERLAVRWRDKSIALHRAAAIDDEDDDDNNGANANTGSVGGQLSFVTPLISRARSQLN